VIRLTIDEGNAPPKTGIGVYGAGLRSALRTYAAGEVEVSDAGASWTGTSVRPLRRAVHTVRLNLLRRALYHGADVVHFTNNYIPPRVGRVAYVATVHDIDPILLPSAHTRRYTLYFSTVIRSTLARSHVLEVHSEALRQDLLSRYSLDPARVIVGGDGLSSEFTTLADATERTLPPVPTLLYVGLINLKKNSPWLVRTIIRGVRSGALPALRLILAGRDGQGFDEVQRGLEEAPDIVAWQRTPSFPDLLRLYCGCTAVVLPSLSEGFGRPLLEGMYCGKAVIASRIPTSVEVAGDAATFFDLGDTDSFYHAVRSAVSGAPTEPQRASAAERLRHYSWERLARVYLSLYRTAVNLSTNHGTN